MSDKSSGFDYGLGTTNIDHETGIRYGVIPAHEIMSVWAEEPEAVYDDDEQHDPEEENMNEPVAFVISDGAYEAQQGTDDSDVFFTKSPYYTWCSFCSPCAPGAGYLLSPRDPGEGIKAYCPPHDWFEGVQEGMRECEYCKGTGKRDRAELSRSLKEPPKVIGTIECWVCNGKGQVKNMVHRAPYRVFRVGDDEEVKA